MVGYGEKYYAIHNSAINYPEGVATGNYRVSVQKLAYAGAATELLIMAGGVHLKQEPTIKSKFFKYCSSSLTVDFVENDILALTEFYTEDEREWLMEYTYNGTVIYRGFIFADNIKEAYINENLKLTLTATDGLKALDSTPFVDVDNQPYASRISFLDILVRINTLLGLNLPITLINSIYEGSMAQGDGDNALTLLQPDQQRFLDVNGNALMAKDVLNDMCVLWRSNCYQKNGKLYFERFTAQLEGATKQQNYTEMGVYIDNATLPTSRTIGKNTSHINEWATIDVEIEPAIASSTVNYEYEAGSNIIGNAHFNKTKHLAGYTTTEQVLSAVDNYKLIISNENISFDGWVAFGGATLRDVKLNAEAISKINSPALFASALNNTNFIRIVSPTVGAGGIASQPQLIAKGQKIALECGLKFKLKDVCYFGIKITSLTGAVNWFNHTNNKWQTTENKISPAFGSIGLTVANIGQYYKYFLANGIEEIPFDCLLTVYIYQNPNTTSADFQKVEIKISNDSNIKTESHNAKNIKKHRKTLETETIKYSDENLHYLPSTIWKGNAISGTFRKKGSTNVYTLIDMATETVLQQYARASFKIRLKYYGAMLTFGDSVIFDSAIFVKLAGKTFNVIENLDYDFERMYGSITLSEVLSDFVTYDRTVQVLDKNNATVLAVSDRIDGLQSTNLSPWTWTNIGNTTGQAAKVLDYFLITATGNDVWDNADNFGYLWRTGGDVSLAGRPIINGAVGNTTFNDFVKIGIMYRESLDADSRFVAIVKNLLGWITIMKRSATGAAVEIIGNIKYDGAGIQDFKIENTATGIKLYYFTTQWVLMSTEIMTMPPTAKIGFCFAMKGGTSISTVNNAVFASTEVVNTNPCNKPIGLTGHIIATMAEPTISGNPCNKPPILQGHTIVILASGSPTDIDTSGGGGGVIDINSIQYLSAEGAAGVQDLNSNGSVRNTWLKIVRSAASTPSITDEAWSYNPAQSFYYNGNTYNKPYDGIMWKFDLEDGWRTDPLVNIPIDLNIPYSITKIFFWNEIGSQYGANKVTQQLIILK